MSNQVSIEDEEALQDIGGQGFSVGVVSQDFDVYTAAGLPGERVQATLDSLVQADAGAYWFSRNVLDDALQAEHVTEYRQLLSNGRVLVFIGLDDPNRLRSLFKLPHELPGPDTPVPDVVYVWEMKADAALVVGSVFLPDSASEHEILREASLQAWYHRGHTPHHFLEASASEMGEHWHRVFGPSEYHWVPDNCGACRLVESKTGWSLDPAHDDDAQNDYVAVRLAHKLIGTPSAGIDLLQVRSDGIQSMQQDLNIYRHSPTAGTPIQHAEYSDYSNRARELFDGRWDYDPASPGAQAVSTQGSSFQYLIASDTADAIVPNYRRVDWGGSVETSIEATYYTAIHPY